MGDAGFLAEEISCKEINTASKCTLATTTTGATVALNTGYAYIQTKNANGLAGNRVNGAFACGQDVDACPGTKFRTLTKDAAATEVKLKVADYESACSYLFSAGCGAPWVSVDTKNAGHAAAAYTGLTMAVVEHDSQIGAKAYTSAEVTSRAFIPATAPSSFTQPAPTDIADVVVKDDVASNVYTDNVSATAAEDGKNQGRLGPKVRWWLFDAADAQKNVETDFATLNLLWAAKRAEYAKFATDKAAYETKKTDYNTKLEAAEKLVKDTLDKDIFRKLTPTADDKKVLNAVPARPMNPSVPALYNGPKMAAASPYAASGDRWKKDTIWGVAPLQETNTNDYLVLAPGKAFGTMGSGSADNVAPTAAAPQQDAAIGMGVVFLEKDLAATPACFTNYMMFQIGYVDSGTTKLTVNQYIKAGSKAPAMSFDTLGTAPAAAADPKVPSTGASMLAAGAATVAVAMTLF